jgi:hypothetical protein
MNVYIDGVKYVPAKEVLINADIFIDKLIEQWWGVGWEKHYSREEMMQELKVHVSDNLRNNVGESLQELFERLTD